MAQPDEICDDNVLHVAVELRTTSRIIGDFMLRWREDEHRQGEWAAHLSRRSRAGLRERDLRSAPGACVCDVSASPRRGKVRRSQRRVYSIARESGVDAEAHFIENEFVKGEWTDEVVLALRASEWRGAQ